MTQAGIASTKSLNGIVWRYFFAQIQTIESPDKNKVLKTFSYFDLCLSNFSIGIPKSTKHAFFITNHLIIWGLQLYQLLPVAGFAAAFSDPFCDWGLHPGHASASPGALLWELAALAAPWYATQHAVWCTAVSCDLFQGAVDMCAVLLTSTTDAFLACSLRAAMKFVDISLIEAVTICFFVSLFVWTACILKHVMCQSLRKTRGIFSHSVIASELEIYLWCLSALSILRICRSWARTRHQHHQNADCGNVLDEGTENCWTLFFLEM